MSKKKILVVDDSEPFQETVSAVLLANDFDVVTGSNGKEGLERLYAENPDLILLDCVMPEMDGYQFVIHLREDPLMFNKPVIMLTGKDSEYDEVKGLALGIDDYIVKPFNPSILIARINATLERKAQSISANPLTMLCGNITIKAESEKRINEGLPFAMIYIDITNFKAFNDRYGFERGDEIIKATADILIRATRQYGHKGDFVGHIGGDDFIVLTTPDYYVKVSERIIEQFDACVPRFYDPEDREKGYIVSVDRSNNVHKFPFMTISLAVISTDRTKVTHYGRLAEIAAELKKLAKQQNRSAFVVDRRRE